MRYKRDKISYLFFCGVMFLIGGCATLQQTEKTKTLEELTVALKQSVQEKDAKINRFEELFIDQQTQLRELNDKLVECNKKIKY